MDVDVEYAQVKQQPSREGSEGGGDGGDDEEEVVGHRDQEDVQASGGEGKESKRETRLLGWLN